MEWMNISYILAFLAVFVASASQILLKQSAETEHKNIITKFLKAKEMLGMRLCVLHNLYFYNHMMEEIREAIEQGRYQEYKKQKLDGMQNIV